MQPVAPPKPCKAENSTSCPTCINVRLHLSSCYFLAHGDNSPSDLEPLEVIGKHGADDMSSRSRLSDPLNLWRTFGSNPLKKAALGLGTISSSEGYKKS
jgi:hypothetical protein